MLLLSNRFCHYSIPVCFGSDFVLLWSILTDLYQMTWSMRIQYVIYIRKRDRIVACDV